MLSKGINAVNKRPSISPFWLLHCLSIRGQFSHKDTGVEFTETFLDYYKIFSLLHCTREVLVAIITSPSLIVHYKRVPEAGTDRYRVSRKLCINYTKGGKECPFLECKIPGLCFLLSTDSNLLSDSEVLH